MSEDQIAEDIRITKDGDITKIEISKHAFTNADPLIAKVGAREGFIFQIDYTMPVSVILQRKELTQAEFPVFFRKGMESRSDIWIMNQLLNLLPEKPEIGSKNFIRRSY